MRRVVAQGSVLDPLLVKIVIKCRNSIVIKFRDEPEFKVEAKALGDAIRIGNDLNKLDK